MKKVLLITALFLSFLNGNAQTETKELNDVTPKFVYCEMIGTQKLLSTKVTIFIDFGEEMKTWKDNRVMDEVTGKAQSFNSMVDALNYMGEQGWEFAQAYSVTVGQQNVYHWLLKKKLN
jgi:hypothetical protein